MPILTTLQERISGQALSPGPPQPAGYSGRARGSSSGQRRAPFPGYDRLDAEEVIDELSCRSQIELEAIERYERSHRNREAVISRLGYLRSCYLRGCAAQRGGDALLAEVARWRNLKQVMARPSN